MLIAFCFPVNTILVHFPSTLPAMQLSKSSSNLINKKCLCNAKFIVPRHDLETEKTETKVIKQKNQRTSRIAMLITFILYVYQ